MDRIAQASGHHTGLERNETNEVDTIVRHEVSVFGGEKYKAVRTSTIIIYYAYNNCMKFYNLYIYNNMV